MVRASMGISNYLTWMGLLKYGFETEVKELAAEKIIMLVRDIRRYGTLHENYQPENEEPICNPSFQKWNYLFLNMLAWMECRKVVIEFDGSAISKDVNFNNSN